MLQQDRGGSIVNMASVGGLLATPGASIYVASKHAVIGLTKSAAIEYGCHGIRVNAVSPAAIRLICCARSSAMMRRSMSWQISIRSAASDSLEM